MASVKKLVLDMLHYSRRDPKKREEAKELEALVRGYKIKRHRPPKLAANTRRGRAK